MFLTRQMFVGEVFLVLEEKDYVQLILARGILSISISVTILSILLGKLSWKVMKHLLHRKAPMQYGLLLEMEMSIAGQ